MSFEELIMVPSFARKEGTRKKVFKSFWMTADENFKIIKKIETENAKKELIKIEKENVQKEAVMKAKKEKAAMKRKEKKKIIKSNPKL